MRARRAQLAELLVENEALLAALRESPERASEPALVALRERIDGLAQQRDAFASALLWHTDFDAAQQEALLTGRPILSLRLLGRLDEELSCANSRFFRLVLYPDPAVREFLAANFVLHWSSERPAPRITIDMGDGRTIVRTITGNSAHYILLPDATPSADEGVHGTLVDILPGLLTPEAFMRLAGEAHAAALRCANEGDNEDDTRECVRAWHRASDGAAAERWQAQRQRVLRGCQPGPCLEEGQVPTWAQLSTINPEEGSVLQVPSARVATRLSLSKAIVEEPLLALLGQPAIDAYALENRPLFFTRMAAAERPSLSGAVRALLAIKSQAQGERLETLAQALALSVAEDSLRNEFVVHPIIRRHLAATEGALRDFGATNAWLYATVFLTPASDPWLGLRSPDVFDGVEGYVSE